MYAEQPPYQQPVAAPQGHSRLGIASLIIAVVTGLLYCLLFAIMVGSVATAMQDYNQFTREISSGNMSGAMVSALVFGLCMFASPVVALVGLGLGIGGFFQKDKQKLFPILGTVFNGLLLCGSGGLLLYGIIASLSQQATY